MKVYVAILALVACVFAEEWAPKHEEELMEIVVECSDQYSVDPHEIGEVLVYTEIPNKEPVRKSLVCISEKIGIFHDHRYDTDRMAKQFKMDLKEEYVKKVAEDCIAKYYRADKNVDENVFNVHLCFTEATTKEWTPKNEEELIDILVECSNQYSVDPHEIGEVLVYTEIPNKEPVRKSLVCISEKIGIFHDHRYDTDRMAKQFKMDLKEEYVKKVAEDCIAKYYRADKNVDENVFNVHLCFTEATTKEWTPKNEEELIDILVECSNQYSVDPHEIGEVLVYTEIPNKEPVRKSLVCISEKIGIFHDHRYDTDRMAKQFKMDLKEEYVKKVAEDCIAKYYRADKNVDENVFNVHLCFTEATTKEWTPKNEEELIDILVECSNQYSVDPHEIGEVLVYTEIPNKEPVRKSLVCISEKIGIFHDHRYDTDRMAKQFKMDLKEEYVKKVAEDCIAKYYRADKNVDENVFNVHLCFTEATTKEWTPKNEEELIDILVECSNQYSVDPHEIGEVLVYTEIPNKEPVRKSLVCISEKIGIFHDHRYDTDRMAKQFKMDLKEEYVKKVAEDCIAKYYRADKNVDENVFNVHLCFTEATTKEWTPKNEEELIDILVECSNQYSVDPHEIGEVLVYTEIPNKEPVRKSLVCISEKIGIFHDHRYDTDRMAKQFKMDLKEEYVKKVAEDCIAKYYRADKNVDENVFNVHLCFTEATTKEWTPKNEEELIDILVECSNQYSVDPHEIGEVLVYTEIPNKEPVRKSIVCISEKIGIFHAEHGYNIVRMTKQFGMGLEIEGVENVAESCIRKHYSTDKSIDENVFNVHVCFTKGIEKLRNIVDESSHGAQ